MKYEIYAAGKWHREHMSLSSACIDARESAIARPGVTIEVERDGRLEAKYVANASGKLTTAWVR